MLSVKVSINLKLVKSKIKQNSFSDLSRILPSPVRALISHQVQTMGYQEMRDFLNDKGNNTSSFNIDQPLNALGGLGKEFKGNIQDTNIFGHLENDYRGKMTDEQTLKTLR